MKVRVEDRATNDGGGFEPRCWLELDALDRFLSPPGDGDHYWNPSGEPDRTQPNLLKILPVVVVLRGVSEVLLSFF